MIDEILYMAGVVVACFAVNYGLRALPFLLFSGRDRELPRWVERFGSLISPVIIAALIVYSYSGLEWKTAWPYLAGLLTVGLQLWKRNPLASIVAGTALYMALLSCGCTTVNREIRFDAEHPAVRVSRQGILFGDTFVQPQEVVGILRDYDVPRERTIHIRLDPDVRDLRPARTLMGYLCRGGYKNPVLVTERHAESMNMGKKKKPVIPPKAESPPPGKVRYKRANE